MKTLYVLFDAECALCMRCRQWLERQAAYVELRFVALQSPEAGCRFPGIGALNPRDQLLVVSDTGDVYKGPHAWIMCLYALREYREWAQRLAHPLLLPFARRVCELVSENRLSISRFLMHAKPEEFQQMLSAQFPDAACADGKCHATR
jgi:predicted DCC family thiol-disulfide oxidoreductase YuxK